MDGFEATKVIRDPRSRVKNHDVSIIAMTAHAMQGDRQKCLDAGMDDYISKPINAGELFKLIDRHIYAVAKSDGKLSNQYI
jgi:CheY-like chemotaxis protein